MGDVVRVIGWGAAGGAAAYGALSLIEYAVGEWAAGLVFIGGVAFCGWQCRNRERWP